MISLSYSTVLTACLSPLLGAAQNVSSSDYVVDLGYAKYQGILNESVVQYYGIPYAQPPLGELRWRAPVDIESRNDFEPSQVIPATKRGPICVQGVPYWRSNPELLKTGSEDCLVLDILLPPKPVRDYLPVLVQIHGGGYDQGDSESLPGYQIVNQSQGQIIYVSMQYRLDAFGFLNSVEIQENGDANVGLLDQRAALGWISRNIRAFGGDPSKVTIIGGSAGGGAVMNQMIMYGGVASPPFRAAIAEYPSWHQYNNNTVLEAQYSAMLAATNCSTLTCLRSQPSDNLIDAMQYSLDIGYIRGFYAYGDFYYVFHRRGLRSSTSRVKWQLHTGLETSEDDSRSSLEDDMLTLNLGQGPAVDGNVIRDLASNEFKQGHFTKVPLITIRDGYEGYNYSPKNETTQAEMTADLQTLFPYAKQSFFSRLYQLYPASEFNSTLFRRQTLYGDYLIACPSYYMATALSDWGQPTYKLIFDAGTQLHGADIPFLWGPSAKQPNNATLANIMKDWYLGFVINLDPNSIDNSGTSKPYWPQYQMKEESGVDFAAMDVNYTMIGVVEDFDASDRCDFFHGQSYIVRN